MSNLVRDFRLINACVVAGEIGKYPLTYQQSEYYRAIGLKGTPQMFTSGIQDINFGFLCERTEGGYILAFRGTLSPGDTPNREAICADWTQGRNYNEHNWSVSNTYYGPVAEGLSDAALSLWNEAGLRSAISRLDWSRRPEFWVTGHSKGGALAVLTHTLVRGLAQSSPQLQIQWPKVVTFGAPMIGKLAFRDSYGSVGLEDNTTRYQNQYDIVPQVPGVRLPAIGGTGCPALDTPFEKKDGFFPVGAPVSVVFDPARQAYVIEPGEAAYTASFTSDLLPRLSPFDRAALLGAAHNPTGDYLQALAPAPQAAGAAVAFAGTPWAAAGA